MPNRCSFCETVRPEGGTNMLVLNGGEMWLEFCGPCGDKEVLTNANTGEKRTVRQVFDKAKANRNVPDA